MFGFRIRLSTGWSAEIGAHGIHRSIDTAETRWSYWTRGAFDTARRPWIRRRSTFGQLRVGNVDIRLAIRGGSSNGWFQHLATVMTMLVSSVAEAAPVAITNSRVASCQPLLEVPNCVET